MPPLVEHQKVVNFLAWLLTSFVTLFRAGTVLTAPFEMRLQHEGSGWEPDIMVIRRENANRLTRKRLEGPADLVIEIISRSTVQNDRDTKFKAYQAGGVREYWIIDSRLNQQRADFYRLNEQGVYDLYATEDEEKVASSVLPGFWIKPAWLWSEGEPDPLAAFAEMAGISEDIADQFRAGFAKGLQS